MALCQPSPAANPPTRAHFLDALRAVGMLLVIMLHAAVPYLVEPMPRLLWSTRDRSPSPTVDALFWWDECFVMPLFFVIAGFAAAESYRARGGRAFLVQRTRRLLVPLLVGGAVILPVTFYIWAVGWVLDGRYPWHKLRTLAF